MRNSSSFNILAAVLIIIGSLLILENFGIFTGIWLLWPVLPLVIGTGFCMLYFRTRKDIVLLGLGTFVTLISMFFIYLNFAGWSRLAFQWPVFLVILGLTFLNTFIFSKKRVLLYLAVILISLGAAFILVFIISLKLWPMTLVLAGVSFIIISIFDMQKKGKSRGKKKK
ncbi:hypothetical protein KY362_04070 [Candidatus Woesearchaeota archaeon]|nr:hypothetical protein [Candidatus Woesearchaeota archaeon]